MLIYLLRQMCYTQFVTEPGREEQVLPIWPMIFWFSFNTYLRICFTYGLHPDSHALLNLVGLTSVVGISVARQVTTILSSPVTFFDVVPLILFSSSQFSTFGREIIPERELCECVLIISLTYCPYLSNILEEDSSEDVEQEG